MSAADGAAVQASFCAVLVDEWVRAGVTDAVVAPGSRNTPLLIALADRADAGRLRLHVVLDERSAGFVALGLGLATGRPAPVVTTSGTAAVELHPAVAEADLAGVPLLAVTADRPPELHHVGAPQTLEQEGLYGGSVRWAVSPGVELAAVDSWRSVASRAVAVALGGGAGGPGPVHLNLGFREPLIGDGSAPLPLGRADGEPWHRFVPARSAPAPELVDLVCGHAGRRGLVVAGGGVDDPSGLVAMARQLGWPVFADPRSGARVAGTVGAFDALLRTQIAEQHPEIVLRAGQLPASKVLGQWLAALPASVPQVLLDPAGAWADPDRRVGLVAGCSAGALAAAVLQRLGAAGETVCAAKSAWAAGWAEAEAAAQEVFDREISLSEPAIARATLAAMPEGSNLVASSSMPVRDLEWFGAPRSGVRVLSNRGANGIDGVISTAIGVALAGSPTVALIGDLAFAYDAGALLWAAERDIDCTYVLVDNGGGGIFSFLPQADLPSERYERLWGTPHRRDLLDIASAYGVETADVASPAELTEALRGRSGRGVRVLRCRTDRARNVADHDRLNAAVAHAVADQWFAAR